MTKKEIIRYIQVSAIKVASVYACSVIFDDSHDKVIKSRQDSLRSALIGLQSVLKELGAYSSEATSKD